MWFFKRRKKIDAWAFDYKVADLPKRRELCFNETSARRHFAAWLSEFYEGGDIKKRTEDECYDQQEYIRSDGFCRGAVKKIKVKI